MDTNARIVSWQERGRPYDGYPYTALTPHYLWDGGTHYWTGMAVTGQDGDTSRPECCQDLTVYDRAPVIVTKLELVAMREGLAAKGIEHESAAAELGCTLPTFRNRIYGQLPMPKNFYTALRVLSGIENATKGDMQRLRRSVAKCGCCGKSIADRIGNFKYCADCAPAVARKKKKLFWDTHKKRKRGES